MLRPLALAPREPTDAQRLRLERELRRSVGCELRFDRLARTIYATDASLYEILPAGVALPRHREDVAAIVRTCARLGMSIVPRGAGTGISGGAVGWGLQLDFSRHLRGIRRVDADARLAVVEPGVVLDELNAAVAPHGLHFAPDVAPSSRATLGGMIANNSCGARSVYYGRTVDHLEELTVVLASGEVQTWRHYPYADLPPAEPGRSRDRPAQSDPAANGVASDAPDAGPDDLDGLPLDAALDRLRRRILPEVLERFPRVMRRNGGYALDRLCLSQRANPATLVCGSEGTLALVVEATLRLTPLPRQRALLILSFGGLLEALAAAPLVLAHRPSAVELVDRKILDAGVEQTPPEVCAALLDGRPQAILLCELSDDDPDALRVRIDALARATQAACAGPPPRPIFDARLQEGVWAMRNRGFGLLMSRPGDRQPYEFIEDAAVDPARLSQYIAELQEILVEEGAPDVAYYAHASVGVIHVRPVLNLKRREDVQRMRRIAERTCALVLRFGGAMTGEHGDGLVRSEWLERLYGPRITTAFRQVKRAFDPDNLLNPCKIVDPLPMDERLRPRGGHERRALRTHLDFSRHGGMDGLARMCSGVGQCRQTQVGTMCPSYRATLDETHTTRARANALRAALSEHGLLAGLSDPALDEVMDLCLSCKACRSECPTGVDMAKLKSEWLAHRNAEHGASRRDRILAHAGTFARVASRAPGLANLVLQSRLVRRLLHRMAGIDARVPPPRFAPRTFRRWWRERPGPDSGQVRARDGKGRGTVIYFVDCWTDAYWPRAGIAAVRLLEAAGFDVLVPELACCGRALISKGFLDEAERLAHENAQRLSSLADPSRLDAPPVYVVGSEPSCILTLIDEFPQLAHSDAAPAIASRVRTVETLLMEVVRHEPDALPMRGEPAGAARVLVHGHCHQKSLIGLTDSLALLRRTPGLRVEEINSGCCGMAGSFGHETEHYEIARAVGEQRLFPAVRSRGDAQVAITGFSCREQIAHHTGLECRHVLELVADALAPGAASPAGVH